MLMRSLLVASALAVTAGCTSRPIANVTGEPVVVAPGKTATNDNVRDAIMRAGAGLGWKMRPAGPGVVTGEMSVSNKHWVTIDVQHTPTTYNIVYRSSTNMNERNGEINRNYNIWVQSLNNAIRAELLRI